jgi:hypothetical protein
MSHGKRMEMTERKSTALPTNPSHLTRKNVMEFFYARRLVSQLISTMARTAISWNNYVIII